MFRVPDLNGIGMFEISVNDIQTHLSNGRLSSCDLVQFCLQRVQATNQYLEAVIEINPNAVSIAATLDRERQRGKVHSPLHGIPILVKDNIATADAMQTTAGSWALLGSVVVEDAFIVSQLRKAGAIIIGHTNMNEWAGVRSLHTSVGYSPREGQCRNPYDLTKEPAGSSGGSAVTVSANIVPLAIGTETDRSIIAPAVKCGVVGIKPTIGLTSRSGVIPVSKNMDMIGPLARTLTNAVYGLDAMVGPDSKDESTQVSSRRQGQSRRPLKCCVRQGPCRRRCTRRREEGS